MIKRNMDKHDFSLQVYVWTIVNQISGKDNTVNEMPGKGNKVNQMSG